MLQRGTIVAGYRIDGVLGEGGMGVVYRATQLSLNRVVALKLLSAELSDDPGFRTRFQREGQLQAGLDHQHIVPVHEAGQTEFGLFLAMRLIAGPTLKDLIRGRQLNPRRTLRVLAQVAQALDAAHGAGLIHRDIKPQNILVDSGDHAYLADFGLIKAPDDASRLTGTGQFIGTIDYVSPEQIQGDAATAASDCYALAAVLYECLTGEVPFPGPNEAATVRAHVVSPVPRVTDRRPDLPPAIDDVVARGMAKDAAERPRSATELIRAAARTLASASTAPGGPAAGGPEGERSQSTRIGALATPAAPTVAARGAEPTRAAAAAEPTPAAATTAERADSPGRRRPRGAVLLALLLVAAAAGGYLTGQSGTSSKAIVLANPAAVGHLQLRYPAGWQPSAALPDIPGLSFSSKLGLSPTPTVAGLTAGEVVGAGGPTLLPGSFRRRFSPALRPGEPVRLGGLQALRYSRLHVSGLEGTLTLYVVPSSAGVATIACWASPRERDSFAAQCDQVAASVRLVGASAYALGPDATYARLLSTTLGGLNSGLRTPLAQLRGAGTPAAQAAAARQLAQLYTTAATDLSRAAVSPLDRDAQAALLAALRQLAGGYSGAAAAAQSGSGTAYGRASAQVSAGATALSAAERELASAGYKVA